MNKGKFDQIPEMITRSKESYKTVKPYMAKILFTPEECDEIVRLAKENHPGELDFIPGEMSLGDGKKSKRYNMMTSHFDEYVARVFGYIRETNEENFRFEDDFVITDGMMMNEYVGDEHCGWHTDGYVADNSAYLYRKLTCVVQLSDPSEYTGGQFELFKYHGIKEDITPKGTAFVIPAFEWHQVSPVITGTRRSLILFVEGRDSFK